MRIVFLKYRIYQHAQLSPQMKIPKVLEKLSVFFLIDRK